MVDRYRIRWGMVTGGNGHRWRGCLAERRIKLLWLIPIWWPTEGGEWRYMHSQAMHDIHHDVYMRGRLPATHEVTP